MAVPQDLADAVLQQLRQFPAVAGAFGDTWNATTRTGSQKFFGDYVAEVDPPYLWIAEIGETYTYMTPGIGNQRPYLADGQLGISIIAESRSQARQLGLVVGQYLNDADDLGLTWVGSLPKPLRHLRLMSAAFQPITQPGPGVPAVFARVLTYQYSYQGIL